MVLVVDSFDILNIWSFNVSNLKMPVGYAGLAIGVLNLAIVVPQVFFFFSSIVVFYSTFHRVNLSELQNYLVLSLLHVSVYTTTLMLCNVVFYLSYAINSPKFFLIY